MNQEYLNSILRYDPETGYLYWRVKTASKVIVGRRAGGFWKSNGYIRLRISGKQYLAHRIIWFMHYGTWPEEIDHENRIRHDNRWKNLRAATRLENARNLPRASNNTSGVSGISWDKINSKWEVAIGVKGRKVNLGRHTDWFDAVCARKSAEVLYGFHPNNGLVPDNI